MGTTVRVVDASLGPSAQVRLVVGGVSAPDRLRAAWASSGAAVERVGNRLTALSTVAALERAAGRCLPAEEAARLERTARQAVVAWTSPAPDWPLPGETLELTTPAVMGICNVTPDSFFDGGWIYPDGHPEAGTRLGHRLVEEGARIVDVGGESTRPGSKPVDEQEELHRVLPVVEALAGAGVLVSIDTTKPRVARAALGAGASIVNDISGMNPGLLEVVAENGAGYVLMHMRGTPADMYRRTDYDDVVAEVYDFLVAGVRRCVEAGLAEASIAVDPGIGFAKTAEQSLALLRAVPQLRSLGRPVLIGASRKSFMASLLGGAGIEDRLEGSLAAAALAVADGASVLRVHDVAETVRVVNVAGAIRRLPSM